MTPEIITPETESTRFQCRHIFTDGRRCGSPAIRGPQGADNFCYYHHNSRRPVQHAPTRRRRQSRFALPNPEDRSAIQQGLGQVLQKIASNEIDPRRAGLLLYGLQIASLNLPRSDPRQKPAEPVSEVIDDPQHGLLAPPAELGHDRPMGSAQRLLEELDALEAIEERDRAEFERNRQREAEIRQASATFDIQASASPEVYAESTPPAQTVRPNRPSKSHRPTNLTNRKERSHEPRSTHDSRPVHPGRARAIWPTPGQPGAAPAPDLHLRRPGRPR